MIIVMAELVLVAIPQGFSETPAGVGRGFVINPNFKSMLAIYFCFEI